MPLRRGIALLAVVGMLAACGSDDDGSTPETENPPPSASTDASTPEATEPSTDAMTEAGDDIGPTPQPLDEPATVTVNAAARIEAFSNFFIADVMGEFEKENITIEYVELPSSDALGIMAQGNGDVDIALSSFAAGYVNAVGQGLDVAVVFPGYSEVSDGIWIRSDAVDDPDALEGAVFGSANGAGGFTSYYLDKYLEGLGMNITDVEVQTFPTSEMPLALSQGAIVGGYMTCPACTEVDTDIAEFVVPSDPALTTNWAGPRLLRDEPEIGEAVVRAITRATRTYLQGDYKSDPEVVSALAEFMGVEEDVITGQSEYGWDPDLPFPPEEAVIGLQETWLEIGDILEADQPVSYDEIFYEEWRDAAVNG